MNNLGHLLRGFNELQTLTLRNKFGKDYQDLPVGRSRQRKLEFLTRLRKGGANKEQLLQHGHRMNMYGSDISTVIHQED